MNSKYKIVFMILAAAITLLGLITGKFLFLFIWLPLGFLFNKKEENDSE